MNPGPLAPSTRIILLDQRASWWASPVERRTIRPQAAWTLLVSGRTETLIIGRLWFIWQIMGGSRIMEGATLGLNDQHFDKIQTFFAPTLRVRNVWLFCSQRSDYIFTSSHFYAQIQCSNKNVNPSAESERRGSLWRPLDLLHIASIPVSAGRISPSPVIQKNQRTG